MGMSAQEHARAWQQRSGVVASLLARRAGLSTSTLHRVLSGHVDPQIGTLREIALACGLELDLAVRPASNPMAAIAARSMLEDGFEVPRDALSNLAVWTDRVTRFAGNSDPVRLVEAAAVMSAPVRRPGAVLYSGATKVGRVASSGDASGGRWALSGAVGLNLASMGDALPVTSILWCEDARAVSNLLADSTLRRTERPERASLAVVEGEAELFYGSFTKDRIHYVAPIQIMIDCLSLGGPVADQARAEVSTW